jgi:hypothetical protein
MLKALFVENFSYLSKIFKIIFLFLSSWDICLGIYAIWEQIIDVFGSVLSVY